MLEALPSPCWQGVLAHANATSIVAMRQSSRCCRSRTVGELCGRVALSVRGGIAEVRDVGGWKLVSRLETRDVHCCSFSPDGEQAVTVSSDLVAKVWEVETGKLVRTLAAEGDWLGSCCFSPDGRAVAVGCSAVVLVFDANNGKVRHRLPADDSIQTPCCFSPGGDSIATSSLDCTAVIWDARSGARRLLVGENEEEEMRALLTCSFSSDGSRLATNTASSGDATKVWCAQTGIVLFALSGFFIRTCLFSPSLGNYHLVTAGSDRKIRIWDSRASTTAKPHRPLLTIQKAHTEEVSQCVFSRDGKLLVSCSSDGTAKVWDAATGDLMGSPLTLPGAICACDLSSCRRS